ncbi:lipopolysaccharide biosynthesis protein [Marinobacter salinisoli]|uniref:Lipopolysaccharide biosynthesis protein n=1 Tax=Marinobacter salinisoli TaxID=2769486 RepID=A0ABX7MSL9_9GAMM|nr:Wzz/FepE/Etk N-terminal domain-containing protein [Marinobacter salinisoli]QSP94487.1 lipopolysaccharide biosynthesis protein [Marinobacter salinisoli]
MQNNQERVGYDDEISLVDLATTLIRRRRIFYMVFLAVLLVGAAYAFFAPKKSEYTSLIKVAEQEVLGEREYIEAPVVLIAELENHWLPQYEAEFTAQTNQKLPLKVSFSNPENTGLIRIRSEARAAQFEIVEKIHARLVAQLKEGQVAAVNSLTRNLETRIESLDERIEILKGTEEAQPLIASAIDKRFSLESRLASIQSMEVLAVSRKSVDSEGPAGSLILLLAGLLGLLGGVFMAFFAEFVALIKERMAEA